MSPLGGTCESLVTQICISPRSCLDSRIPVTKQGLTLQPRLPIHSHSATFRDQQHFSRLSLTYSVRSSRQFGHHASASNQDRSQRPSESTSFRTRSSTTTTREWTFSTSKTMYHSANIISLLPRMASAHSSFNANGLIFTTATSPARRRA